MVKSSVHKSSERQLSAQLMTILWLLLLDDTSSQPELEISKFIARN